MARNRAKYKSKKSKKSLPIWLIMGGAGLLLVAAIVLLSNKGANKAAIEVTGAPRIKVEQDVYDYGVVKLGAKPIRTEVRVTNVGDQSLRFIQKPYVEVLEGC